MPPAYFTQSPRQDSASTFSLLKASLGFCAAGCAFALSRLAKQITSILFHPKYFFPRHKEKTASDICPLYLNIALGTMSLWKAIF
jgi:hypothetical protein